MPWQRMMQLALLLTNPVVMKRTAFIPIYGSAVLLMRQMLWYSIMASVTAS